MIVEEAMKPRATAVVLALVLALLAVSVSEGGGACCPPAGETAPMFSAIDCCAAMVSCAPRTPAALAAARRADLTRVEPLAVVSAAASHPILNSIAAAISSSAPRARPPLQRLPAPLRI